MQTINYGIEAERVRVAANELLRQNGKRQRLATCTGALDRGYKYRSTAGKTIVVPIQRQHGQWTSIKSILQRVDEKRRCNWLINGQADINMSTLFSNPYNQPTIGYCEADAFEMEVELMASVGHDDDLARMHARDRLNRLPPELREYPQETCLMIRDCEDAPHAIPLAQAATAA